MHFDSVGGKDSIATNTRSRSHPTRSHPPRSHSIWQSVRTTGELLHATAQRWLRDDAFQLAAALAFYTVFSFAPLIVIAVAVASLAFGRERAVEALVSQVDTLVGHAGSGAVRDVVESAAYADGDPGATLFGAAALVIGATAVFAQLQVALNRIWDVEASPGRGQLGALLRGRLVGFALAIGAGFVLATSLAVSAMLSATEVELARRLPEWPWLWRLLEAGVSFVVIAAVYMTIYKTLPDVEIAWSDVAVGGCVSALLFGLGKYGIGLYLGRSPIGSVYGTAGSFAVLLVWVYYSALVSFFGAEFTRVFARRQGSRVPPSPYAVRRGPP